VPGDSFLDLLHGVRLDPCDYVVDPVDDIDLLDVGDVLQFLEEVLLSP
jgi:hypothetical protein